jgi:hypothetical protein
MRLDLAAPRRGDKHVCFAGQVVWHAWWPCQSRARPRPCQRMTCSLAIRRSVFSQDEEYLHCCNLPQCGQVEKRLAGIIEVILRGQFFTIHREGDLEVVTLVNNAGTAHIPGTRRIRSAGNQVILLMRAPHVRRDLDNMPWQKYQESSIEYLRICGIAMHQRLAASVGFRSIFNSTIMFQQNQSMCSMKLSYL